MTYRSLLLLPFALAAALAQDPSVKSSESSGKMTDAETKELNAALSQVGSSPAEFARTLERHLVKYPQSPQLAEIEKALVKAAIDARDEGRTLRYGERLLARDMDNPQVLERVSRILLRSDSQENAERALKYSRHFETLLLKLQQQGPSSNREKGRMLEELDKALGRALVLQARSAGNLGEFAGALALSERSYGSYASAEAAREAGRWLTRLDRKMEAVHKYAEAFVLDDGANEGRARAGDRRHMAELYISEKGSEAGLGDFILQAYDRVAVRNSEQMSLQRERDPNTEQNDPMEFTVTALSGEKFKLSSLRGKVVVMDFWATWCGPCRVQHPLYEKVKGRFTDSSQVVFLAMNTDENIAAVKPFLQENGWNPANHYFEDGLSELLKVSSIPTTIIIDRKGRIFTRLNGFVPEIFVDQLTSNIKEAIQTAL